MPWHDWQFYVVTAVAVWGAWMLLRQLFPHSDPSSPACGACAAGSAACAKKPRDRDAVGLGHKPEPQARVSGALVVLQDRRSSGR